MSNKIVDVIHIGMPKTATTWLQNDVIPSVKEIASLGKPFSVDKRYRDLLFKFTGINDLEFDAAFFKDEYCKLNREKELELKGKVKLISFELLSGEMYFGADAKILPYRIKAVFGNVKIIMILREQKSMVESIYKYYVMSGGSLNIRSFINSGVLSPAVDIYGNRSMFFKYKYDLLINLYRDLFGKDNVLIMPYELLKTDKELFLKEFFLFCNVGSNNLKIPESKINVGFSFVSIKLLRFLNYLFISPKSNSPITIFGYLYSYIYKLLEKADQCIFKYIFPKKKFIEKHNLGTIMRLTLLFPKVKIKLENKKIYELINQNYAVSNKKSKELTGIDLEQLGYYLDRK